MPSTNPSRAVRDGQANAVKPVQANRPPDGQPVAVEKPLIPPDEKFWQRYSPNAEMPLSGLASAVLHGMVLGIMLLGVFAWFSGGDKEVEMEPILFGDGVEGGGGGNVMGQGAGPQLSGPQDVPQDLKPDLKPDLPKPIEADTNIKPDTAPKLADDPDAISIVDNLKKKNPTAGVFMKDALEGLTGKGGGGKGWGGGTGDGVGTGIGDKMGPGTGKRNARGARLLRWTVNFNTKSGEDYVRQLNGIGAIIGVPDKTGKLMIIRNLSERPAKPKYENIRDINRIFWVDERADSARAVADALQLDLIPSQIVAFFPIEVEKQLVEVELAYGKKYGRKTEADIRETEFAVSFRAGKPVFTVKRQEGQVR